MTARPDPQEIIAASERLLAEAQQLIDQADAKLRSDGLDPAKFLSTAASEQAEKEGRALFEADMQAIEREVEAERMRLQFHNPQTNAASKPVSGGVRRPRNMI